MQNVISLNRCSLEDTRMKEFNAEKRSQRGEKQRKNRSDAARITEIVPLLARSVTPYPPQSLPGSSEAYSSFDPDYKTSEADACDLCF